MRRWGLEVRWLLAFRGGVRMEVQLKPFCDLEMLGWEAVLWFRGGAEVIGGCPSCLGGVSWEVAWRVGPFLWWRVGGWCG